MKGNFLNCSVIIVAAGKGTRMGNSINKQFMNLNGRPILEYTLKCFDNCHEINNIILVINKECINYCKNEILYKYNYKKDISVVAGGKERQNSVYNGLEKVDSHSDIVLIHDGVRPFVEIPYIQKVIYSAYKNTACILGLPVKDTIKVCTENNFVESTPKREKLWAIQTPQGFKYDILIKAYKKAIEDNFIGTDDSTLVERIGYPVKIEEGSYQNIKITTSEDLIVGESILNNLYKL